jgi:hypothetical protein
MALWGKADGVFSPGTVTANYTNKTITGAGTSFLAVGVTTGAVITIGAGGTFGNAVISGITSETQISIATTQYLSGAAIAGIAYSISQKPVYTLEDTNFATITGTGNSASTNRVYGVDEFEQTAATESGSKYAAAHAGWVGVHTYIDCENQLRVKTEVLVAMSGISTSALATYSATGDADDDAVYADNYITISAQPTALVGVATTASQSFVVTAAANDAAALSFQWQFSTAVGAAFTNVTTGLLNGLIYTNPTTATLGIAATTTTADRPDGYFFRVNISTAAGAAKTSDTARLTYA